MKGSKFFRWLAYWLVAGELITGGWWPRPGVQEFLWLNGFLSLVIPFLYPYALKTGPRAFLLVAADLALTGGSAAFLPAFPSFVLLYMVSAPAMAADAGGIRWGLPVGAAAFGLLTAVLWSRVDPAGPLILSLAAALILSVGGFALIHRLVRRAEGDRVRLREYAERQRTAAEQIETLFGLATDVRTEAGPEEIASSLVSSVRQMLVAQEAALISGPAGEAEPIRLRVSGQGESSGPLPNWLADRIRSCGRVFCPARGCCRRALEELSFAKAGDSGRWNSLKTPGEVLCTPLLAQSMILGSMFVFRQETGMAGDPGKLLQIAAALGASAIRNLADTRKIKSLVLARERKRIAEEINGGVGLTLASSLGEIERSRLAFREPAGEAGRILEKIQRDLERSLKDVRRFVYDLKPLVIAGGGLEKSLESYFKRFEGRFGIDAGLKVSGDPRRLGPNTCETVFRLVQESTLSLAKQGRVRRIEAEVRIEDSVTVSIRDDGGGLDPDHFPETEPGMGLTLLAERAEALGGGLKAEILPDGGTVLLATLPLGEGAEGWTDSESLPPTVTG